MKKLNKKGISIVEAVIAMALLIIVTVTSLTLALSSTKITNNSVLFFRSVNQTADFVTIFQEAENAEDFKNLIKKTYVKDIKEDSNGSITITYNGVITNLFYIQDTLIIKSVSEQKIMNKKIKMIVIDENKSVFEVEDTVGEHDILYERTFRK